MPERLSVRPGRLLSAPSWRTRPSFRRSWLTGFSLAGVMAGMVETSFPFWVVFQRFDNRLVVAESLGFPEVSRLGGDRRRVGNHLLRNLRRLLVESPLADLYRRHVGAEPVATEVALRLDPVGAGAAWRDPLPLSFPVVTWDHGSARWRSCRRWASRLSPTRATS